MLLYVFAKAYMQVAKNTSRTKIKHIKLSKPLYECKAHEIFGAKQSTFLFHFEAECTAARLGSSCTIGTRQVQHCGTPLCQWQLEGETV
jgi:hypothetical protein